MNGTTFTVSVSFDFKINNKEKAELVALECLFDADYILLDGFQPSSEQIEAFRHGPAIFNCWPFFREYVQSIVLRMNYPAPTIPFLWLVPKTASAEESQTTPTESDKIVARSPRGGRKPKKSGDSEGDKPAL